MKYIICHAEKKIRFMTLFNSVEEVIECLHTEYTITNLSILKQSKYWKIAFKWEEEKKNPCYLITAKYVINGVEITNSNMIIYGVPDYVKKEI